MDILEAIVEMEKLVKLDLEQGSRVVVNPFWVAHILLDISLKRHQGLGEVVSYTM